MKILSTITDVNMEAEPQDIAYTLKDYGYLSFLDSSLPGNKYSRFSYIAWKPSLIIKSTGYRNESINISAGICYYSYQHPLSFLKKHIRSHICSFPGTGQGNIRAVHIAGGKTRKIVRTGGKNISKLKLPDFRGGFIGYFSYDLKNYIEKLPSGAVDDMGLPVFYLLYYDRLLAYGHGDGRWYYIKNFKVTEDNKNNKNKESGDGDADKTEDDDEDIIVAGCFENDFIDENISDKDLIKRVRRSLNDDISAIKKPDDTFSDIKNEIIEKYRRKNIRDIKLRPNMTKRSYTGRVIKIKQHIHDGDIYQANFSQRFEAELPVEPADLYYILREKNAAPFSAFLKFPGLCIGSSSPERFLFLKGDIIETRPIKGTRPRGIDSEGDNKNMTELKNSVKDRAELNMIVDLERNDLGKFCYYGTVRVAEHAVIEKYARVYHSVSTVTGRVKKGTDISDIIKAAFPGGSITGAPKIRAMEIIDGLEPTARGVYTGSIGYIGIDSTTDLNIVIRTFVIKKNKFYYNVGGGIVEDSIPEEEYNETLDKGIALAETLKFFTGKNLKKIIKTI
jgi:para-aminobenzoate synthetase component I